MEGEISNEDFILDREISFQIWRYRGLDVYWWKFTSTGGKQNRIWSNGSNEIAWRLVVISDDYNQRPRICHFACLLNSVRLNCFVTLFSCRFSKRTLLGRTLPNIKLLFIRLSEWYSREIWEFIWKISCMHALSAGFVVVRLGLRLTWQRKIKHSSYFGKWIKALVQQVWKFKK